MRVTKQRFSGIAICAAVLYSCASNPSTTASNSDSIKEIQVQPIPATRSNAVQQASKIGELLFERDQLAARATDAVMAKTKGKPDARVTGWVLSDASLPSVYFVGDDHGSLTAIYEVTFAASRPMVIALPKGTPLASDLSLQFAALLKAQAAKIGRCSETYNAVVLPGSVSGETGWLVYLLAATDEPGVIVFGGHHKVHVSADAKSILSVTPFSKSCLNVGPPPTDHGKTVAGAAVTHLVSDIPAETHVFLSLLHRQPIYVGTSLGSWRVEGDEIDYFGPHPER